MQEQISLFNKLKVKILFTCFEHGNKRWLHNQLFGCKNTQQTRTVLHALFRGRYYLSPLQNAMQKYLMDILILKIKDIKCKCVKAVMFHNTKASELSIDSCLLNQKIYITIFLNMSTIKILIEFGCETLSIVWFLLSLRST